MIGRFEKIATGTCAAALLVSACSVTDVGNPQTGRTSGDAETKESVDVDVRFEGLQETPDPAALSLPRGTVIREAWVVMTEFVLFRGSRCTADDSTPSEDAVAVDLLESSSDPELRLSDRDAGSYCGLEFELDQLSASEMPDGAPSALAGRSVLVRGERSDGTAFELRAAIQPTIELERAGTPFQIDASRKDLLLSYVMEQWIDEEALDSATGDAPIVIDRNRRSDVFEHFREQFPTSAHLFRDVDADGTSDPSEPSRLLASSGDVEESDDDPEDAGTEED